MLTWHFVTRSQYDAAVQAGSVTDEMLCFLSDTGELYRGTKMFNESVVLYDELPVSGIAMGKLYINSATLEGRIWNGSAWVTVINPVAATVDAGNTTAPVTGSAVASYVSERIQEVTGSAAVVTSVAYTAATNTLVVTTGDGETSDLPMTNVAAELKYDKTTGKLELVNAAGTALGSAINLDLERFVSEATYDDEAKKIVLSFNDESDALEIPIGDLVDTYTAEDSTTIKMTVTGNKFTANAIVSEAEGNVLVATDNGLYVAATDISGKVDKVAGASAGDIATLTAEGGIADSGYTLGDAELGNDAKVLATEAAVNTYIAGVRTALEGSIATKMAKVDAAAAGQVIRASSTGDAEASGYTLGGETFTGGANVLATEKGAQTYVQGYAVAKTDIVGSAEFAAQADAASDAKVTSEKAVVDALTWKTSF